MARWKLVVLDAVKGYGKDRCSSFAAAIAYFALLSLFPLTLFAVSLGGYILRNDPSAQDRIINVFLENLPLDDKSGRQQLTDAISTVIRGRAGLGLIGLAGVAYSASALFGAVRTGLNVVFRVERQRPLVQGKLIDLGLVLGLGVLVLLSLTLTAAIALLQRSTSSVFGAQPFLTDLLFTVAYFILPTLASVPVFMVLYRVVPHAGLGWRDTLPGALLAAIGFELLKIGFSQYTTHFANFNAVYGTLGFVILFLSFAYLSAQIVLFGAEFTRSYDRAESGAVAAAPKRHVSLSRRVGAAVKSLFVTPEPHHDA